MRIYRTLLLLILLVGFQCLGNAQDVRLVVTTIDGAEQSFQLTEESQLYFNNGENLVIEDVAGTATTFQLSQIRKIICAEVTGTTENALSKLQLFPNPSRNGFIIRNLQDSCPARIYSLDGRLMMQFVAAEGMSVDISGLSSGMYLLHINGETLKLMKL
ncbi:MAG: T9SS type A sorting domain-containing protein [Bacteroidales bacterium]|nr:T9SS type A sorting domain-containing protein [Bacteroidales bacterium]